MSWELALKTVIRVAEPLFSGDEPQCAVIGSVASVLQGCQLIPRDLDLLASRPEEVARFAELMWAYAPQHAEHPTSHADWLSSEEQPLSIGPDDYGFVWHFGRWLVDGMRVEMAHIAAPEGFPMSADGAGIWEAGPEIWPHIRHVPFAGVHIPVVPLEIQIQTSMSRGLEERTVEIIAVLQQSSYDRDLVQKALSNAHLKAFDALIGGPVD
jgi:hypothetical protein